MAREDDLFTDSWPRERKAVFNSPHSHEGKGNAQMRKPKWYTPRLSRELVTQLYHRAKFERVPMPVLANRLMAEALDNDNEINTQRVVENQNITERN
jgi:hypothetical protein